MVILSCLYVGDKEWNPDTVTSFHRQGSNITLEKVIDSITTNSHSAVYIDVSETKGICHSLGFDHTQSEGVFKNRCECEYFIM